MLATIGIVDCIFRRVSLRPSRFHSWAWETAVSLPSEWDGTEQKHHRFLTPTVKNGKQSGGIITCMYMHVIVAIARLPGIYGSKLT